MEQRRKRCLTETTLYGWGSNSFGQLAHPKVQTANTPVKIEIPDAFSLNQLQIDINSVQTVKPIYLEDIVCSGRMSGLISSAGDLWMCGNIKDLGKKKDVEDEKLAQLEKDEELAQLLENEESGRKGNKSGRRGSAKKGK